MRNDMFCLKEYSAYDTCPKAELQDIPDSWKSTMTLDNYVTGDGYTYLKKKKMCLYAPMYMTACTCRLVIGSWIMLSWFATLCSFLACLPHLLFVLGILVCAQNQDWCFWIWLWHYFSYNFFTYWIHLHSLKARWQCVKFWRQPNITFGLPLLPGWSVYRWIFSDASPRLLHLPYHMWVSWTNFM